MEEKILKARETYVTKQREIVNKIANELSKKIDEEISRSNFSRTVWTFVSNSDVKIFAFSGGLKCADEAIEFIVKELTKLFGSDVTITTTKFGDKWLFNMTF